MNNTKETSTSTEEVLRRIDALTEQEKSALIYTALLDTNYSDIKRLSLDWSYELDVLGAVNDYKQQRSRPLSVVSLLDITSIIMMHMFESQARQEMQCLMEGSQFGMELSNSINDLTTNIQRDIKSLVSLMGHYNTVLQGRRLGYHFHDEYGKSTPVER